MKAHLVKLLLLILSGFFAGCETDVAPAPAEPTGGEKFRRGVTGQGALVQPDRSNDPMIREESRVGY